MPTFARPEMLALSLECLSRVPHCPEIHIYVDRGVDKSIFQHVRDKYSPAAFLHFTEQRPECTSGTWNILHSLQEGYSLGADRILIVEEDVMVYPTWLDFHLREYDAGAMASCGRRVPMFFKRYGDIYTNPGSCLSSELMELVIPHICDEYFAGTGPYIKKEFGREPINSSLDDGLIRMVMNREGWLCAYPDTPVCAHQGFEYYNELDIYMNYETDIDRRVERAREILSKVKPTDRYAQDFEPYLP